MERSLLNLKLQKCPLWQERPVSDDKAKPRRNVDKAVGRTKVLKGLDTFSDLPVRFSKDQNS